MAFKNKVLNTFFENFHQSDFGSVFSISDSSLDIQCCYFAENSCNNEGGCIYCLNSDLIIEKTSFYKCCSQAHKNDFYGNVLLINGIKALVKNINTYLCSYSEELSSDSSLAFLSSLVTLSFYNASNNYGYKGASGYTLKYTLDNSIVSYTNIVDSRDESVVQSSTKCFSIYNSNFINCVYCTYILYQNTDDMIILHDCIFMNTGSNPFVYSNYHIIAYNTKADRSYGDIIKSDNLSSQEINIDYNCNQKQNENDIFDTFSYIKTFRIFIISYII